MFANNIKQIFRGLMRYKEFTMINLLGLSIGIAATVIIFMISDYDHSFDTFHSETDKIYRVVNKSRRGSQENYSANVPYPMAATLRNEYPGLVATQIHFVDDMNVSVNKQAPFGEENIVFADSVFFEYVRRVYQNNFSSKIQLYV